MQRGQSASRKRRAELHWKMNKKTDRSYFICTCNLHTTSVSVFFTCHLHLYFAPVICSLKTDDLSFRCTYFCTLHLHMSSISLPVVCTCQSVAPAICICHRPQLDKCTSQLPLVFLHLTAAPVLCINILFKISSNVFFCGSNYRQRVHLSGVILPMLLSQLS